MRVTIIHVLLGDFWFPEMKHGRLGWAGCLKTRFDQIVQRDDPGGIKEGSQGQGCEADAAPGMLTQPRFPKVACRRHARSVREVGVNEEPANASCIPPGCDLEDAWCFR
jgi:hypothetical protein